MPFIRTASPPAPPPDWLERLQELVCVRNLLNGDTTVLMEGSIASRLAGFLADPSVSEAWQKYNAGRPRL